MAVPPASVPLARLTSLDGHQQAPLSRTGTLERLARARLDVERTAP